MSQPAYKYRLTSDRRAIRTVNPVARPKISWNNDKSDYRKGYNQTIEGEIKFQGSDYLWLLKLEKSKYRCLFITLHIDKLCGGTYISDYAVGRLAFNNAKWDLDKQEVIFKVDKNDRYKCYDDYKDAEYNMFAIVPDRITANLAPGILETITQTYFEDNPDAPPAGDGWAVYGTERFADTDPATITQYYARYDLGGGLYKPPIIYNIQYFNYGSGNFATIGSVIGLDNSGQIDNGIRLYSLIQALHSQTCGGLVKSNFFQWNPDSFEANNYVTGQPNKLKKLAIFQKSDVKRPYAAANASIGNITLDKLLNSLCMMFNCQWDIDDNGSLIIEHYSWFENGAGLDLTLPRYTKNVTFSRKYSYDSDSLPSREQFTWMDATGNADFKGQDIYYRSSCVNNNSDGVKAYNADIVTTDVIHCLSNPLPDSAVKDDGFVIMALDEDGNVYSEPGILGAELPNNVLGWALLHRDFYRHGRSIKQGYLNGALTTFLSTIKSKKQDKIIVPLCCGEDFNPNDLINTTLGSNASVRSATYDLQNETLEVELLYGDDDIVDELPKLRNDYFWCWKGYYVEKSAPGVLQNDLTDAPPLNVANPGVYLSSNGTFTLNTDGSFMYTPRGGFVGQDEFDYEIIDSNGDTDFGKITINVIEMEIGMMLMWPGSLAAIPPNWMHVNGGLLNISEYPELFDVIGTIWGGDGVTTFALPPCGIVPVNSDPEISDFDTVGKTGGHKEIALEPGQIPELDIDIPTTGYAAIGGVGNKLVGHSETPTAADIPLKVNEGGGGPHDNMPPYGVFNFIIKYRND
ncbi:MAG: hypothetical protein GXC72_00870 [Chitinophagaceae bacterium]|nr:hypothetical protein [Chitinophagaceae bacterium]